MQELEEMATKLLATARELPPGQDHHNALREIARFRAQIAALQGADLRPAQRGPKAEGEVSAEQIRELEKMTKELVTVARKLPHGPDRETVLQEIREFRAQISVLKASGMKAKGK